MSKKRTKAEVTAEEREIVKSIQIILEVSIASARMHCTDMYGHVRTHVDCI